MKRIVAAFLSGICPGLGQIYGGRPRAAFTFLIVIALLTNIYAIIFTYVAPLQLWVVAMPVMGALIGLMAWGACVLHALILRPLKDTKQTTRLKSVANLVTFFFVGWAAMLAADIVNGLLNKDHIIDYRSVSREGSMLPTVASGEYIAIWRNYHSIHDPQRGEIITFSRPDGDLFVKRIVGMPGDSIEFHDGRLSINDQIVERDPAGYLEADGYSGALYRERLPGGATYTVLETNRLAPWTSADRVLVPEGHYFVLGDNRNASFDSRDERFMSSSDRIRGAIDRFVPKEQISGHPTLVLYSNISARVGSQIQPAIKK